MYKLKYYMKHVFLSFLPKVFFEKRKEELERKFKNDIDNINERVDYYCKFIEKRKLDVNKSQSLKKGYRLKGKSAYYFDLKEYLYFFPCHFRFCYYFGDKVNVENCPTLYKARPTYGDNSNSVLFKMDKLRHFKFINDTIPYEEKKNMAVFRGSVTQKHRISFMEKMFGHPLIDAGQSNKNNRSEQWMKPYMTIEEQLTYKFIISLEGNDVATNLKWIMSSNSIVISPKMKFETWFMEGSLIPDVHFIEVKDDWSDFDEKIKYYLSNPEKAKKIIDNANRYVSQFLDEDREDLISIKVLEKYFGLCEP